MNAPDVSDLRPAPRRPPTLLLWCLFVVAIAGTGWLVFEVPKSEPQRVAKQGTAPSKAHGP